MQKNMHTPWGCAQHVEKISIAGDVIRVDTASHGGIGVARSRQFPASLIGLAIQDSEWLWFEEDCAACAPVLAFPSLFGAKARIAAEASLRNWFPSHYEQYFGRKPTAAESSAVAQSEFEEKTRNNFVVRTGFGDWAWDVPAGSVYAVGFRASDKAEAGFLVPKEQYRVPGRLVLDGFPRWEPNRSLPYSKPPRTLDQSLRQQADSVFQSYHMGDGVTVSGCNGWEHDGRSQELRRAVYVETNDMTESTPSIKLTFVVRFNGDKSLEEAYAIDGKGQIWGQCRERTMPTTIQTSQPA